MIVTATFREFCLPTMAARFAEMRQSAEAQTHDGPTLGWITQSLQVGRSRVSRDELLFSPGKLGVSRELWYVGGINRLAWVTRAERPSARPAVNTVKQNL
jgi:hypothetical protein